MTDKKTQYSVSFSDETIKQILALEKEWGQRRDDTIAQAILYTYESNYSPYEKQQEKVATHTASNIAISILQQSLDEGREIRIPSLGITIEKKEKTNE